MMFIPHKRGIATIDAWSLRDTAAYLKPCSNSYKCIGRIALENPTSIQIDLWSPKSGKNKPVENDVKVVPSMAARFILQKECVGVRGGCLSKASFLTSEVQRQSDDNRE